VLLEGESMHMRPVPTVASNHPNETTSFNRPNLVTPKPETAELRVVEIMRGSESIAAPRGVRTRTD
jgi:hypothetical protein